MHEYLRDIVLACFKLSCPKIRDEINDREFVVPIVEDDSSNCNSFGVLVIQCVVTVTKDESVATDYRRKRFVEPLTSFHNNYSFNGVNGQ